MKKRVERLIDACALQEEYKARHSGKRLLLIDVAPTVDATPVKRGRWIKNEFGSRCECCGLYAYRYENGRPWESDYCPYCGADMRGEQP